MARIRSIHPDQWTDEQFVSCGPEARLLALGIRTFADDNGILPHSPMRWKMQVFPADPITKAQIEGLVDELVESGQVMLYEADGKPYAAIRNFTKFQSPRKPSYVYPVPQWWGTNGYSTRKSSEEVRNQYGTGSVPVHDGGGKGEGGGKGKGEGKGEGEGDPPTTPPTDPVTSTTPQRESSSARAKARPANGAIDFDPFKAVYPKRAGSHRWQRAYQAANARMGEGSTFREMVDGAERYATHFCEVLGKVGTEYVMQAATFLGSDRHFLEPWDDCRQAKRMF